VAIPNDPTGKPKKVPSRYDLSDFEDKDTAVATYDLSDFEDKPPEPEVVPPEVRAWRKVRGAAILPGVEVTAQSTDTGPLTPEEIGAPEPIITTIPPDTKARLAVYNRYKGTGIRPSDETVRRATSIGQLPGAESRPMTVEQRQKAQNYIQEALGQIPQAESVGGGYRGEVLAGKRYAGKEIPAGIGETGPTTKDTESKRIEAKNLASAQRIKEYGKTAIRKVDELMKVAPKKRMISVRGIMMPIDEPTNSALPQTKKYLQEIIDTPTEYGGLSDVFSGMANRFGPEMLPFIGAIVEATNNDMVRRAAEKPENRRTVDEQAVVDAYSALQNLKQIPLPGASGFQIGRGIMDLIPYAAEFALTDGVYQTSRALLSAGMKKVVGLRGISNIANAIGKSSALSRIASGGEKVLTATGAGVVQSLTNAQQIAKNFTERAIPKLNLTLSPDGEIVYRKLELDTESVLTKLLKVTGLNAAEFVTERWGIVVEKPMEFLKRITVGRIMEKTGIGTIDKAIDFLRNKTAFQGIVPEVFEEWVNYPIQTAIENGQPELMDKEQLFQTTAIVGAPTLLGAGARIGGGAIDRMVEERRQREMVKKQAEFKARMTGFLDNPMGTTQGEVFDIISEGADIDRATQALETERVEKPPTQQPIPDQVQTIIDEVAKESPATAASIKAKLLDGRTEDITPGEKNLLAQAAKDIQKPSVPPEGEIVPPIESISTGKGPLALKTRDGQVFSLPDAKLHSEIVDKFGIPETRIVDTGYLDAQGKFVSQLKKVERPSIETMPERLGAGGVKTHEQLLDWWERRLESIELRAEAETFQKFAPDYIPALTNLRGQFETLFNKAKKEKKFLEYFDDLNDLDRKFTAMYDKADEMVGVIHKREAVQKIISAIFERKPVPPIAGGIIPPEMLTPEEFRSSPPAITFPREAITKGGPWEKVSRELVAGSTWQEVHKKRVEKALAEGRPVYKGYEKDYPDLAKKYGVSTPKPVPLKPPPIVDNSKTVYVDGTFYHNTDRESAESILKNGFNISDTRNLSLAERGFVSGNLGDGIYLSPDLHQNMNKVGDDANLQVTPTRKLKLYDLGNKPGSAQISIEFADKIKDAGYDGIIVNDPHPKSGGYQVIVFDPQNLTVKSIVEDNLILKPEDLSKIDITKSKELPTAEPVPPRPPPKMPSVPPVEPSPPRVSAKAGSREIPMESLVTDEARFQTPGRTIDEELQQARMENYNRKKIEMNPINYWYDPKLGKNVVLVGHHREALARRIGEETITGIEFEGTEEEAIQFAQNENAGRKAETALVRAQYYRAQREKGVSPEQIKKALTGEVGRQGANHIMDLSYLNPRGTVMDALKSLEGSDVQTKGLISTFADWIGGIRKTMPKLTDSHENEMFGYLKKHTGDETTRNKTQFEAFVQKFIDKNTVDGQFNPAEPLNLTKLEARTLNEREYDASIERKRQQRLEAEQERDIRDKKLPDNTTPEQRTKIMKPYIERVTRLEGELQDLIGKRDAAFENIRSQEIDLFGTLDEVPNEQIANAESRTPDETEKSETIVQAVGHQATDAEATVDPTEQEKRAAETLKKTDEEIKNITGADPKAGAIDKFKDAINNLDDMFGAPSGKGVSEPTPQYGPVDETTYQKAKYYFDQALRALQDQGKDASFLAEAMRYRYGEKIDPFVQRYLKETEDEFDFRRGQELYQSTGELGALRRPSVRLVNAGNLPKAEAVIPPGKYEVLDAGQRYAVNLFLQRFKTPGTHALLADGTGFGKTFEILPIAAEIAATSGKPSLIITQNKAIIAGSYADAAKLLGITLSPKTIQLATYDDLRSGKVGGGDYGLIVFDEAHNLKHVSALKTEAANKVKADHQLFATATPMDGPAAASYFMSRITGMSEEEVQHKLGYQIIERTDPITGDLKRTAAILEGHTWPEVFDNIIAMRDEAIKNGSMIRREYPFYGVISNRNMELDLMQSKDQKEIADYWDRKIASTRNPRVKKNFAGQKIGELSRWLEQHKANEIIKLAQKKLSDGRSVIIVAEGINETTIKGLDGGTVVPGLITVLSNEFKKMGTDVAKIHGTGDKSKAVADFQGNKVRVAIMTPRSGGAGINLDDTKGDFPRTMIIATANFSGDVFDQIMGRASRRNTASPVEVIFIQSPNGISDLRRRQILDAKLGVLKRIQMGEDPDRVDLETSAALDNIFGEDSSPESPLQMKEPSIRYGFQFGNPETFSYDTGDEQTIKYQSLTQKSDVPSTGLQNLYRKASVRPLLPGEIQYARRFYEAVRHIRFYGAHEKIRNAADAAAVFRSWETSTLENSGLIHINADGKQAVQILRTGTFDSADIDPREIAPFLNAFGTTEAYFAHHHPSGNIYASGGDYQVFKNLQRYFPHIKIHGIIIDIRDGLFGSFDPSTAPEEGFAPTPDKRYPLKAIEFSKQEYLRDLNDLPTVRQSGDAAKFWSAMSYGAGKKLGLISLNSNHAIVAGHWLTGGHDLSNPAHMEALKQEILSLIGRSAGVRAILIGNQEMLSHEIARTNLATLQESLRQDPKSESSLLDYVGVEPGLDTYARPDNWISAQEEGVLREPKPPYGKAEQEYINEQLRKGNLDPLRKQMREIERREAELKNEEQQLELNSLIEYRRQIQREIASGFGDKVTQERALREVNERIDKLNPPSLFGKEEIEGGTLFEARPAYGKKKLVKPKIPYGAEGGLQPWQMTREEYERHQELPKFDENELFEKIMDSGSLKTPGGAKTHYEQIADKLRKLIDPELFQAMRAEREGESWRTTPQIKQELQSLLESARLQQEREATAAGSVPDEKLPADILFFGISSGPYSRKEMGIAYKIKSFSVSLDEVSRWYWHGKEVYIDALAILLKSKLVKVWKLKIEQYKTEPSYVPHQELERIRQESPWWFANVTGNSVVAEGYATELGYEEAAGGMSSVRLRPATRPEVENIGEEWKKEWDDKSINSHRQIIQMAVAEGKPVPPEVLADYPDLANSALKEPTAPYGKKTLAPIFFSNTQALIEEKMPTKAPVYQIQNILKQGKQEEIKWTGLDEYLRTKDSFTKQEILDYLKANEIRVEEVEKSEKAINKELDQLRESAVEAAEERSQIAWALYADERDVFLSGRVLHWMYRHNGKHVDVPEEYVSRLNDIRETITQYEERRAELEEIGGKAKTKYGGYVLPGAKEGTYRELLLTLPVKRRPITLENVVPDKTWRVIGGGEDLFVTKRKEGFYLSEREGQRVGSMDFPNLDAVRDYVKNWGLQLTPMFSTSHFEEPNILAHIRFNERETPDGKRTLFIEELQSDWAQKGRRLGFGVQKYRIVNKGSENTAFGDEFGGLFDSKEEAQNALDRAWKQYGDKLPYSTKESYEIIEDTTFAPKIPDAPFLRGDGWKKLALRRMIRHAAEKGYDSISWTTGEQQAERYDLSKQVDKIGWSKLKDGTVNIGVVKDGQVVIEKEHLSISQLEDTIGKEATKKIVDNKGLRGELQNPDLKVGGEGMKGFYDKELVNIANDIGKKFGAKVGETKIETGKGGAAGFGQFERWMKENNYPENPLYEWQNDTARMDEFFNKSVPPSGEMVHSLPITPEMRESVLYKGQQLFEPKPEYEPSKPPKGEERAIPEDIDISTAGLPFKLGGMDRINPVMMPELLKMAKYITGRVPILKNLPSNYGYFKSGGAMSVIAMNRKIQNDPRLMAMVLAHEIGHGTDWMDTETLKRGNLIGRLLSMTSIYMKNTFPSGFLGDVTNKQLKAELVGLSAWWKPFDPSANLNYTKYRGSAKELYADFLSVLLNAPKEAKDRAPKFYNKFFENLDRKPSIRNQFLRLQMMIANPDMLGEARWNDVINMFKKAEDVMHQQHLVALAGEKSVWFHLKSALGDKNAKMLEARKQMIDAGRIEKLVEGDPRFALEENDTLSVHIQSYLRELDPLMREMKTNDTMDLVGGILFLDRIQAGDRWEFANPLGHIPGTAGEQLEWLKKKYPDKFEMARSQADKLHDWFNQVRDLMAEDMMTPEQVEATAPGKSTYATFRVVKYMKDWVSAGLIHQKGTFEDIGNPFTATIMKGVSMIRAARRNQFKKEIAQSLLSNQDLFSDEVEGVGPVQKVIEAKVSHVPGQLPYVKPHADPHLDVIMWKEGGKFRAAYVDKYIVNSFNHDSSAALANAASVSRLLLNNTLWRPLLIGLSPGFQARNLFRDFLRTYKALPQKSFLDLLRAYRDSIPSAKNRARGVYDDIIVQMEKEHALNVTLSELMRTMGGEEAEIEALFHRYGVKLTDLRPGWQKNILGRNIAKFLEAAFYIGNVIETVPKVAAYSLLDNMEPRARATWIRNNVGTPNPKRRGTAYIFSNNLILFSNINKEGWRSDYETATLPTTRAGWWWRTVMLGILPKLAFRMAMLGLFGTWLASWAGKQDKYRRRQNMLIPLGEAADGSAVSMVIPHDESTRIISGLFDIALDAATKEQTAGESASEATKFMMNQAPFIGGAHPLLTIAGAWSDYLNGRMPRDAWRGFDILTEDELKYGGVDAWTPLAKWTLNQTGLVKLDVHSKFKEEPTWEQSFRVIPGLNALLDVTNMGEYEKAMRAVREQAAKEAGERIEKRERIVESAKSGESVMEFLRKEKPSTIGEAKELYAMRERIKAKGSNDPVIRVLSQSTSNAQKRAAIKAMQKVVPERNLSLLLDAAEEEKILSEQVKFDIYIDLYNDQDTIIDEPTIKDVVGSYQRMPKELQGELYPLLEKKILHSDEFKKFTGKAVNAVTEEK